MSAPSGYTALDFVGFTDKGTYSTSSTYMRNDLVHYGGNIMRCLIDNTSNITPIEGANWALWVGASANLAERTIAPLENNPADVAYGVGRQIIYDDWLWEVIAPIAIGDTLVDYDVDPTNANIKKSAPVETQLLGLKNSLATVATSGSYNDLNNKPSLGTAAAKNSTNAVTQNSTDLVESGAVYSEVATLSDALTNVENTITSLKVIKVSTASFSSLPQTINNSKITANHEVINSVLSNPSAITSDITWTTASGSITLSGTISGSTTITLYLAKSES